MGRSTLHTMAALCALFVAMAWGPTASASAGAGRAKAPAVDAAALPSTAVVRPDSMGDEPHPVEARLWVEQDTVAPGGTVSLGVQLMQAKDWHTYWRFAGDVGQPTTIEWTLPEGATAAPRQWPAPERFLQSDLVSYGYSDEVMHITEVTLPADAAPGQYPVSAQVSWLVCKTSCIQGEASLATTITVAGDTKVGSVQPLFAHYRAQHPVALAEVDGLDVRIVACRAPFVPNEAFQVAVAVQPADGHELADPGSEAWPAFTPVLGPDVGLEQSRFVRQGKGFVAGFAGTVYEPVGDTSGDVIGGQLQVTVDGTPHTVLATVAAPWAKEGTPVEETADPVCAAAFGDAVAQAAPDAPDGEQDAIDAIPRDDEIAVVPTPSTAPIGLLMLLTNFGLAFVGGLILNVMPCVLPVLTLKLYGLVDQAGISDADKRQAGLLYTLGILVSFWVLAGGVWGVRNVLGEDVSWGYQMQYPGYVATLATLVFVFGLSLFGVFEIPAFGTGRAHELSSQEGPGGYFFTGVFATLVATPCSAPFLGTATAFAFQAPTWMLVAIFSFVGLGLASPFLLVAFVPAAYKLLPQPGEWMETFKQFLGFTLMATTVWLLGVLVGLVGEDGGLGFVAFLTAVGLGTWIFGRWGGVAANPSRQLGALAAGLVVSMLGGWQFLDLELAPPEDCDAGPVEVAGLDFSDHIPWVPWSPERVDELRGNVLFIDGTADWCVSCKVNEKTVLESSTVRQAMARFGVVPLEADYTRKDPRITALLQQFRRAGVPLYVVVPPTGMDDAILLPEVITSSMVVAALERAAAEQVGLLSPAGGVP